MDEQNAEQELTDSSQTSISVENVWCMFGRNAKKLMTEDIRFSPKQEILEKTGCILALKNVSFTVKQGEFFVIMGLSGSGKSTIIRTLLRLIEPSSGSITIDGQDICALDRKRLREFRRHNTGMVFQNYGLFPHYTILENAAYGLQVRKVPKAEREAVARTALETVGLDGWENYYPDALSGGMQQRVGIARALANDPQILLMDEPFSGLDPLIRRQMQDELVDLHDRLGKTIIFVTHDLHEALKLGDRIAMMKDGEIVQLGTPEEIVTNPATDYVKEFVKDADPSKVLTASNIMEEPETLLYRWEGTKIARTILKKERKNYAFVVDKRRQFLGVATRKDLDKVAAEKDKQFSDAIQSDMPKCLPDDLVEELFNIATDSRFPIPVVDENNRLHGVIPTSAIFDVLTHEDG